MAIDRSIEKEFVRREVSGTDESHDNEKLLVGFKVVGWISIKSFEIKCSLFLIVCYHLI